MSTVVTWPQVLRWRIHRHLLGAVRGTDAATVAARVCGVHAQLAASAVSATDRRCAEPVDAAALDDALWHRRSLVRTWAARGTLHLLPADELPRWVAAMSTRTRETTGSWLRYHGVTAEQMADLIAAAPDVLGAEPLTREELAAALVEATGHGDLAEPLTHGFGALLKPLAFRGLLCSGPPRGRQVTFVAPRHWLGDRPAVDTDAAVDALVLAHLGAYGPADPAEFARWFDLKPPLAKRSFARLGDRLAAVEVDGRPGWVPAELLDELTAAPGGRTVHLLPAFDPYVVGSLRQLDTVVAGGHRARVSRPQGWIAPTLVVDGRIEGVWAADERTGAVTVTAVATLDASTRAALGPQVTVVGP